MTPATDGSSPPTAPTKPDQVPSRPTGTSYQRLYRAVDALDMSEDKKEWMKDRWLDQLWWFDRRAEQTNWKHSLFRVVAIAGGVLVPALVSVSSTSDSLEAPARWTAFGVSLLVALSVGLDSFFHFGERWRHYRRTAELLTMEGWQFIEKAGRYREKLHHHRADFHNHEFPRFASQVEQLIRQDVEVYLTRIVQERSEDADQEDDEGHHEAGVAGDTHPGGEQAGTLGTVPSAPSAPD